ncbi:putative transposon protein [Cucumis melo var. makuwa]|uniref:Transposon protein n=1 Tax=Cucumis melo var. makuwa TaxID=1194695 RepID=A0A5A7TYV1_CUCMM|nr:putative transposon protein [Cucumis melo var. makuwa]TYK05050.1 putative transposon protein [Cucumis melo var. makuwa]
MLRKEDSEARAIKKERILDLMEENEHLIGVISSLNVKSKEVQNEYDQTIKSVKMLNSGTDSLDSILNSGHNGSSKYGLGFDASMRSVKLTPEMGLLLLWSKKSYSVILLQITKRQEISAEVKI